MSTYWIFPVRSFESEELMMRFFNPATEYSGRHFIVFQIAMVLVGWCQPLLAQVPKFVELKTEEATYSGKIVAKGAEAIYLMQRDGQLRKIRSADVKSFRKLADQFIPMNPTELRELLRREFRDLEIIGTGSYLVAGSHEVVREYGPVFEDQYRSVRHYFSVRGFDLPEPDFPLVAIIFPDSAAFIRRAEAEGFRITPGVRGYYSTGSNRISLFHEQQPASSQHRGGKNPLIPSKSISRTTEFPGFRYQHARSEFVRDLPIDFLSAELSNDIHTTASNDVFPSDFRIVHRSNRNRLPEAEGAWASLSGSLEATMLHEATHQVAFNIGIHQRLSNSNPRWLVEGLATAFEAPGMRSPSLQKIRGAKLNPSRFDRFQEYAKHRRPAKSLERFLRNGDLSGMDFLDGYAQSWALTFFLIETRPKEYANYLKIIASHPPLAATSDEDRIVDFCAAFGKDLVLLEAKFLRFMEQLR